MSIATANTNPIFAREPRNVGHVHTAADTTVSQTVLTAGSEGYVVNSITCYSEDSTARDFRLTWNDGATDFPIGVVNIPLDSGSDGIAPAFNLLDPSVLILQEDGSFTLPASATLKLTALVTIASNITFTINGGDY